MDEDLLDQLGIEHRDRPATRGEVALYLTKVVLAERRRLARILTDIADRHDRAEAIANPRLYAGEFEWRE
jgi:hypothetical protein